MPGNRPAVLLAAALALVCGCAPRPASAPVTDVRLRGTPLESAIRSVLRESEPPWGIILVEPDPAPVFLTAELRHTTVGRSLDLIVRQDPRYEWWSEGTAILVAPRGLAGQPEAVWNARLADLDLTGLTAEEILSRLAADPAVAGRFRPHIQKDLAILPVESLRLERPRLREAFSALAGATRSRWRAAGSEVWFMPR